MEITTEKPLTLAQFNNIEDGVVFKSGYVTNNAQDIHITDQFYGMKFLYVVKKGYGNDWAIYAGLAENKTIADIVRNGNKITNQSDIKHLVPCTDEVLARYRY